jgi:ribosomal protein S18 acetylase RimI-like enzyme
MTRIKLEPMTQAQYSDFIEAIIPPYVAERAAADHVSAEVAERYARHQHARLLPEGLRTTGHRFLRIVSTDSDQSVGGVWFWIDVDNKQGFLYNITVFPRHRRRGFASDALALVEEMARSAGCTTLGLNVFSSNDGAIALYRKLGFSAVSSYWNKPL